MELAKIWYSLQQFDIVSKLEGNTYISGMGAKKYQNEDLFLNNGIQLKYSDFKSKFETLDIPQHFLNKSILSYLVHFNIEEIKSSIINT